MPQQQPQYVPRAGTLDPVGDGQPVPAGRLPAATASAQGAMLAAEKVKLAALPAAADLSASLAAKAPVASPTFTGTLAVANGGCFDFGGAVRVNKSGVKTVHRAAADTNAARGAALTAAIDAADTASEHVDLGTGTYDLTGPGLGAFDQAEVVGLGAGRTTLLVPAGSVYLYESVLPRVSRLTVWDGADAYRNVLDRWPARDGTAGSNWYVTEYGFANAGDPDRGNSHLTIGYNVDAIGSAVNPDNPNGIGWGFESHYKPDAGSPALMEAYLTSYTSAGADKRAIFVTVHKEGADAGRIEMATQCDVWTFHQRGPGTGGLGTERGSMNMTTGAFAWVGAAAFGSATVGGADVATEAYVDTAIANLVGTAPAVLDTLGEIADALADDADLAGTLTASIATKASKSGDTFTGRVQIAPASGSPVLSLFRSGVGEVAAWMNPGGSIIWFASNPESGDYSDAHLASKTMFGIATDTGSLLMKSPNGTTFTVSMTNAGTLQVS